MTTLCVFVGAAVRVEVASYFVGQGKLATWPDPPPCGGGAGQLDAGEEGVFYLYSARTRTVLVLKLGCKFAHAAGRVRLDCRRAPKLRSTIYECPGSTCIDNKKEPNFFFNFNF